MISAATISLTQFEARHLQRSREWFNDPALAKLLDRSRQISQEEHEAWFAAMQTQTDCAHFAIENGEGLHIGNVWLHGIDRKNSKAELRIVIGDTEQTGRGIGSEAIRLLSEFAFRELDLQRVYAYVLASNPRAKRAFEKAGYQLEGTLRRDRSVNGAFTDAYLLSILRGEERAAEV